MDIEDMEVTIIRSHRRTIAIQVNPDLTVTVRAPKCVTQREIQRILREKDPWIQKHIEKMKIKKSQCETIGCGTCSIEEKGAGVYSKASRAFCNHYWR